jgi:hypothetical protein
MSDAFTIEMSGEGEAQQKIAKLHQAGLPAGLHSSIARKVADATRDHLKERDRNHPNKLGGKRSHFYWNAAETVQGSPTVEGAVITINQLGLRQRWLGGDIYPVHAKMLAIPARAEAYGVSPKDFPGDLTVIKFRSGAMALVKDEQTHTVDDAGNIRVRSAERGQRKTRKRTVGLVEYWLKDHVYQAPDSDVLPSPETILNAAIEGAGEYFTENE